MCAQKSTLSNKRFTPHYPYKKRTNFVEKCRFHGNEDSNPNFDDRIVIRASYMFNTTFKYFLFIKTLQFGLKVALIPLNYMKGELFEEMQGKHGATKSELEALQALVTALESNNMEMMTSISGLKEDSTQNMADLEAAKTA